MVTALVTVVVVVVVCVCVCVCCGRGQCERVEREVAVDMRGWRWSGSGHNTCCHHCHCLHVSVRPCMMW